MLKQLVIIPILLITASCSSHLLYDCSMLNDVQLANIEDRCTSKIKNNFSWCHSQARRKCDYLGKEKSYYKNQGITKDEN